MERSSAKGIKVQDLEEAVEAALRVHIKLFLDTKEVLQKLNRTAQTKQIQGNYRRQIVETRSRMERAQSMNNSLYSDYADGTIGDLDVAFKNLIYDYYSREILKKQIAQQRQYNSNGALYGYRKSEADKHKLVIESEEAAAVREIFNMKTAGIGTTMIAKTLNDREISSLSELYQSRGSTMQWKNKGRECYWTVCKVEDIIRDEKYTGTMV